MNSPEDLQPYEDHPEHLTRTLGDTMARNDVVFSFGGIGGTPDDRTRQCAAV